VLNVDRGERMEEFEIETSKNFVWRCQHAVRVKKKCKARRGIITRIRKGIEEINVEKVKATNGVQERRLRLEERLWRIDL